MMPNRDKTGPAGKGSLTGRKMGPCLSDKQKKILSDLGIGRRPLGRGLGLGLGRRRRGI